MALILRNGGSQIRTGGSKNPGIIREKYIATFALAPINNHEDGKLFFETYNYTVLGYYKR